MCKKEIKMLFPKLWNMPRFGVKMRIAPCEVEMFCSKCGLIKEKFLFTIPCETKIKNKEISTCSAGSNICYNAKVLILILERLRTTFTANGKREFVPLDEVFPSIVVYCLLLLLKTKLFHVSFINKNWFGQFLSSYFLFWEILNLNMTFAFCRERDS